MRRSTKLRTRTTLAGRLTWAAAVTAVATAAMVGVPLAASASPQGATTQARSAATTAAAVVYGGVTPQGFPVVIELSKDRRHVVRGAIALRMPCTTGGVTVQPDDYRDLPVSRAGKFRVSFGPVTVRNDDGTTTDWSGKATGVLNDAKTKLVGTWQLKLVDHDAAGAVTDTFDSGTVTWRVKQ